MSDFVYIVNCVPKETPDKVIKLRSVHKSPIEAKKLANDLNESLGSDAKERIKYVVNTVIVLP